MIAFIATQGVTSSSDITIRHIENYLKTIENKAVKYVGTFLYVFRNFFSFLYERGYIADDLVPMLPKVRTPRNASIPYVWSKTDIQKLLCAIDREDPKGKRDYAILLIAIRLGLRIGDIRSLKKSSIDWNRKTINLNMVKTGQPIELPLLKNIGWAIIDYLQNGRPATNSECLFVRHRAPFNAFGDRNTFNKELHRYILKAGLNIPGEQRHGMHSLRSTLVHSFRHGFAVKCLKKTYKLGSIPHLTEGNKLSFLRLPIPPQTSVHPRACHSYTASHFGCYLP
ncbi:MAG: tyrosine-type recombinase/integrase [Clostridia bacterium]|nr:tyrosine-type recombinase/integrase [Clostridia bacterium]